jgi:hypothetical protein
MKRREPTEAQVEVADLMRQQLERHGMDASDAAVRAACRERLRAQLATQAEQSV